MGNKTVVFKKVPLNEVQNGTEIAILKHYMDIGLIQDPKTSSSFKETSNEARYYPVNLQYKNIEYNYQVKAYPTSNWGKDRRLIIKTSDPIFRDREEGDFLCLCFDEKIDSGSNVTAQIIKKDTELHKIISLKYMNAKGLVLKQNDQNELINKIFNDYKTMMPLNQILYGPPGTGKTYHTVIKSMVILGELEEKKSYTEAEYKNALDIFQQELGNRIEFVSMHQSFSYEDFVQGLRPKTINGSIQFEYTDGVFKNICKRASEALTGDRSEVGDIQISNNEIAEIAFFLSKFNGIKKDEKVGVKSLGYQSDDEAFHRIGEKIGVKPNTLKNHRDRFDFKFNDRIGYTSRKGWIPRNGTEDLDNTVLWPYQEIYDNLNDLSLNQLKDRVLAILKKVDSATTIIPNGGNFVIILDEINRANISKVFGELITLIEEDKREMFTVRLPSGQFFSVPTNLYIIGTMNTADKSVSMVDIALRRRFEFEAMYPNIELVKDVKKKQFMIDLNREIIDKKGIDFQIGHSDFMKDTELINIINRKVIPLLMEYFRNRHDDVSEILNKCLPFNLELDKELLKNKLVQVILKNN